MPGGKDQDLLSLSQIPTNVQYCCCKVQALVSSEAFEEGQVCCVQRGQPFFGSHSALLDRKQSQCKPDLLSFLEKLETQIFMGTLLIC